MAYPFLDTNIIIRFLAGDDLQKQAASAALFAQIEQGQLAVAAPATVIADAVFVLHSPRLYNKSRADVQALLTPLVRLPHFHVQQRRIVLRALELYGASHAGFGDALLLAAMDAAGATTLYSYDQGFEKVAGITRQEP